MSKRVLIIGGGVIGLCTAYYCARRGFNVSVVERKPAQRDGCSFGNAGMIVPSHFVPLAAPGMVKLGLKWMWNPASPFYIRPRFDLDLFNWGIKFMRAANAGHVRRAAPLLRDLSLASRKCFEEFAALPNMDFGLVKKGLLMLCKTSHTLDEESKLAAQARALGVPAEVLDAKQTAALDPGARLDIAGAVYFPMDCHLTTHRFMAALQAEVERLGGRFIWNSDVREFKAASPLPAPPSRRSGALGAPRRRKERAGRGTGRGAFERNQAPPLPGPLLRCAEERECRAIRWRNRYCHRRRNRSGRIRLVRRVVVVGFRSWTRLANPDASRQRLQPHAPQTTPASANLFHLHRGARGGDADGRLSASGRHDGDCGLERRHQSHPRARHH